MSFNNQRRGQYGDFSGNLAGLGRYTDFSESLGGQDNDMGGQPEQQRPTSLLARNNNQGGGGGGFGGGLGGGSQHELNVLAQELMWLKQDNQQIRAAVVELGGDRDNLRQAIRKLKVENSRMKQKMKRMADVIKAGGMSGADGMDVDGTDLGDMDFYEDIGEYLLIGGPYDPFSLRFEVAIKDAQGLEHKSAERFYWYKMAEAFGDMEAAEKIRSAGTLSSAEEAMKAIKEFDESVWAPVKLKTWEEGQRLKVDQNRWIQNLMVQSNKTYLAVASQDKVFGTGWRKGREESAQPRWWDGDNAGGKALMKMRELLKTTHTWMGPNEEQETEKKYNELKKTAWRRQRPENFMGQGAGRMRGGGSGGFRGSSIMPAAGRGGRGQRGSFPQKRQQRY